MNHLAHFVLSGEEPHVLVGGLLGDFWHGAPDPDWPPALARGVVLHRRVDTYTDAHAVVTRARALFAPPFRRYAGILLDVWFDHLLACDFARHTGASLARTAARAYAALRAEITPLPPSFRLFAAHLEAQRALERSDDPATIEEVLERIADRLQRSNPVASALPVIESLAPSIARAFEEFWPELVRFAASERERLGVP